MIQLQSCKQSRLNDFSAIRLLILGYLSNLRTADIQNCHADGLFLQNSGTVSEKTLELQSYRYIMPYLPIIK